MTRLFNDPVDFAEEMIEGFVAANRRHVRAVSGGVARSTRSADGAVALVIGGGSGHYPAFGGLVGPGLAHGAAMGNLFASPSRQQVYSIAKATETGGGVLLSYGNYAGDVLNFDAAQEQLRAEGIRCETVAVTDDVASAPKAEKHKRRGIAGDLTVFKVAGAASERGADLDEVLRVASRANDRTRSFGVAFTGCTLPGAEAPLFSVPEGRMAVGLGIHGEPGIAETDLPTADELAELYVMRLLDELPDDVPAASGQRVVAILNGLGSVKYEELFVVYRRVAALLEEAGVEVVDPQVGEFCTSFDMAGASLTLMWLDEELESLWGDAASSPSFRTGSVDAAPLDAAEIAALEAESESFGPASAESQAAAALAADGLEAMKAVVDENVDELGRIDAVAGDGDHGIGMQRGVTAAAKAARAAAEAGAGAESTLRAAGDAWSDKAGGTSGALWGSALTALAGQLGDESAPTRAAVAQGVDDARAAIQGYGKAEVGDKTMVDALVPFAASMLERVAAGDDLPTAWTAAAEVATAAAAATADLLPKMGRARTHHEKSLGTPDAGAYSFGLVVTAVGRVLTSSR